jgi:hypothetical protein
MTPVEFPSYLKTKGEARALIDQLFPKEADAQGGFEKRRLSSKKPRELAF